MQLVTCITGLKTKVVFFTFLLFFTLIFNRVRQKDEYIVFYVVACVYLKKH